jgi:hypothetical protein
VVEVKNNNQLARGASKVGGGWQKSINNHTTTRVGDNKHDESIWQMMRAMTKRAKAARAMVTVMRKVTGKKEGKCGKGHGVINEGDVQQRG